MADEKTTQFSDAETLDGTELIGIVQSGANVQSTTYTVSNFVNTRTFVQMGKYANGGGESGVAIGYYSQAFGPNPIAIGNGAYAEGVGNIAIGYHASAPNNGTVAIGAHVYTHGAYTVAVGARSYANGTYAVAVGAYANAETSCIAIGYHAKGYNSNSIGIGSYAKGYGEKAIAIGQQAQAQSYSSVAIGAQSYAQDRAVALGFHAMALSNYSVSIGNWSECLTSYGVAIGTYTYTVGQHSVAVGSYSGASGAMAIALGAYTFARQNNSVAIGAHAVADATNAFALGASASAQQSYSMVIGSGSVDAVVGSFVVSGYPVDFQLRPSDHYQKFVGQTVPVVSATAEWSGDGWTITVSYPGNAGNGLYAEAVPGGGDDQSLSINLEGNTLVIILGTDSDGDADPTKNTIAQIAALFPSNGFSFGYTGSSDTAISDLGLTALTGGADGTPTIILTADGESPDSANMLTIWEGAIATLTGRVTGAGVNIFSSSDDAASFVLTPQLVYRTGDSLYHFIGTPTFTLENSTEGAVDWPVPTLTIDGDTSFLDITVVNEIEIVNWMGHFKFETSQ